MAARVALLLAFTGFFAVAWDSDQKAEAKILAAKNRSSVEPVLAEKLSRQIAASPVSHGLDILSTSDFSNCTLPEGIVPGAYRVVDGKGAVAWVTIPARKQLPELQSEVVGESKSLDFFSSQTTGGRWYFIRVEAAPVVASPQEATPVLR